MKVSIIVPAYNAAKHIKQCINSLLKQTFNETYEILIIDDKSTDNTLALLKKFEKNNQKIKVLKNEKNLGVDKTRFRGIVEAKGTYLMFVDADDWISSNAVELLYNKIVQEKADVVTGGFVRVLDKFGLIKKASNNNYSKENIVSSIIQPQLMDNYFISYFGVNKLLVNMWGKLYRKEFIINSGIEPSGYSMGEDLIFNLKLHPFLNKIAFITEPIYFYRFGGMTSASNPNFLVNIKEQFIFKEEMIKKYKYEKARKFIQIEVVNCFYSHFLNLLLFKEIHSAQELKEKIQEELADSFYEEKLNDIDNEKAFLIKTKNYTKIVEIIYYTYSKRKFNYRIKRIISSLFT